jgi:toxin ParE1/3/4
MRAWLEVLRTPRYEQDIQDVHDYIEQDNANAAMRMLLHIEDQVDSLADPNFPRRKGRIKGTLELVAHPNYVVVIQQSATTVVVLNVLHVATQYP